MQHTRVFAEQERRGWSLSELARRMGCDPSYVGRVRSGDRPIRGAFIEGARRAFPELPLDYLFPAEQPQPA